jgi:hypothetical protein
MQFGSDEKTDKLLRLLKNYRGVLKSAQAKEGFPNALSFNVKTYNVASVDDITKDFINKVMGNNIFFDELNTLRKELLDLVIDGTFANKAFYFYGDFTEKRLKSLFKINGLEMVDNVYLAGRSGGYLIVELPLIISPEDVDSVIEDIENKNADYAFFYDDNCLNFDLISSDTCLINLITSFVEEQKELFRKENWRRFYENSLTELSFIVLSHDEDKIRAIISDLKGV